MNGHFFDVCDKVSEQNFCNLTFCKYFFGKDVVGTLSEYIVQTWVHIEYMLQIPSQQFLDSKNSKVDFIPLQHFLRQ